ncbi:hypothetical protein B0I22_2127 [Epilithonimonas xixisoli]|uniref:Uncharacterized protein n=1 Tax=Epilithonimonas xixisoli TaxID=1476462 RepID=A0A4V3H2K3_9FLAO|nr:hypothetical protein B0I22_2127 [Epilithonimonas xixisoli]
MQNNNVKTQITSVRKKYFSDKNKKNTGRKLNLEAGKSIVLC